jgi:pyruvate/2-oxoglutarate/acetoin dehydrogenase E1 component
MTTLVVEIYEALKKAGVEEELARSAAKAVISAEEKEKLATKADLRAELAELKASRQVDIASVRTEIERMGRVIVMWNMGTLIAVASIIFAIMRYTGGSGP